MKRILLLFSAITVLSITGCGSAKSTQPMELLTGTAWELSSINGKKLNAADYSHGLPIAVFTTDNKVSGNSSCNQYSGSYNLNDSGGMNISQVMSTKMFCEGSIENEYFKALGTINMSKIDKDRLILMQGVEERLIFVPKK